VTDPQQPAAPYQTVPPYGYQMQPGYPGYAPPPPALAPTGQPLAEFVDRVMATVMDGLILSAVLLVVSVSTFGVVFAVVAPGDGGAEEFDQAFALAFFAGWLVFVILMIGGSYIYYVQMMYGSGQTVGKRVMKIQVIPVRPGEQLTRAMAARRWLAYFVPGMIIPFWSWLEGLWQLWDKPYRQCLHDKFAETVVIKLST
jgi:uncharacterized RDD family membrane protein YckC